eukprot:TRINITY_DN24705_c0_g1_i1.p1 TRINITY_DN24705_c0_g1~~TRINITY_DN24705_c0_g1_i1.p1  ORF type:complete len:988 (+),score=317.45 TRINITY_DN24705_c0_g1_i1:86-2965(+)
MSDDGSGPSGAASGSLRRSITWAPGCAGEIQSSRAASLRGGGDAGSAQQGAVNPQGRLGTINGCFLPCLLNILGAVLFLRIGFSVGMMGVMGTLGILAITAVIAYLTIFSFSAIVTNGRMRGGGAYYMISRNLGPAFGGSSGLLFWFTYCVNVTFNAVAFTQTIQSTFFDGSSRGTEIIISVSTLFVLFLVGLKGADAFASTNYVIAAVLFVSLVVSIGSLYFAEEHKSLGTNTYDGHDYHGYYYPPAWDGDANKYRPCGDGDECAYGMKKFLWPHPVKSEQCVDITGADQKCTFNLVFAVMFPAMVGTMQGANLSGDLRNPARSIPLGTLAAITTAFVLYLLLMFAQAATLDANALHYDMNAVQHACVQGGFVVAGVTAACLSTALGSMFGAARVLQAIARDRVFPILTVFERGSGEGDEPRLALALTWIVAEAGVLVGGLDAVAPILTNCFLVTYALVNLACLLLTVAGVPNWRPTFRLFSWQSALLGALLNVAAMFYLNPIYAAATLVVLLALFTYVSLTSEQRDWGDISQALLFHQARKMLLALQHKGAAVPKFWRPSLLLLSGPDGEGLRRALLSFCDDLKKGGLLVVGAPVVGADMMKGRHNIAVRCRERLMQRTADYKCFCRVAVAPSMRLAVQNLLLGGGLGPMNADTVVVALPEGLASVLARDHQRAAVSLGQAQAQASEGEAQGLLDIMRDALSLQRNVGLACGFSVPTRAGAESAAAAGGTTHFSRCAPASATQAESASCSNAPDSPLSGSFAGRRGWSEWFDATAPQRDIDTARIDVWRLGGAVRPAAAETESAEDDPDFLVSLQMGYCMALKHRRRYVRRCCTAGGDVRLRVFHCGDMRMFDAAGVEADVSRSLRDIRVRAEVAVVPSSSAPSTDLPAVLRDVNLAIRRRCADGDGHTAAIFITMPSYDTASALQWIQGVQALTEGLPPCLLLRAGEAISCTTTAI